MATQAKVFAERAYHLAIVSLTRVEGVVVSPAPSDHGIDLLVTASPSAPGRIFGVEVKGATAGRLVNREGIVREDIAQRVRHYARDMAFPVGVMICEMPTDMAYFGWVLSPHPTHGSKAPQSLALVSRIRVALATKRIMSRAIKDVNAWYDQVMKSRHLQPS